jgi:hypothetical protein
VTPEEYDEVLDVVDWETVPAHGGVFHVVWFDDAGMRIVDVWESQPSFEAFMAERVLPVVAEMGIEGEPQATFHPVHRYFNTETARAA